MVGGLEWLGNECNFSSGLERGVTLATCSLCFSYSFKKKLKLRSQLLQLDFQNLIAPYGGLSSIGLDKLIFFHVLVKRINSYLV